MSSTLSASKRVALAATLLSMAICASLLDTSLQTYFQTMPFLRLGLSNIFVLLGVLLLPVSEALLIATGKVLLPGIILGNLGPSFLLAATGTAFSFLVMLITRKKSSIYFISQSGAIFHNLGQFIALSFVLPEAVTPGMLRLLLLSSIPGGIIVAACTYLVLYRAEVFLESSLPDTL
ncbi:MAG: Gx transporter family protein [Candidatus Wallbacteria bacterium]|nr:Gx transporter family protein [Candidatus Wallbacteria bacterium]